MKKKKLDTEDSTLPPPVVPPVDIININTKNFKLSELEKDCQVPSELLDNAKDLLKCLQILRDYLQKPITIISGYRSKEFNDALRQKNGGDDSGVAKVSQHSFCRAADIQVQSMTPRQVADAIFTIEAKQAFPFKPSVGLYANFVHFDIRTKANLPRTRWGL